MGLQFPTGWNASFSSAVLNSFANEPHCKNNPIAKTHNSFVLTVSILKGLNGDWSTLTKPERRSVTFTFPDWAFFLLLPAAVRALKAMRETACETEAMVAPLCHKCKKKTAAVRCLWRLVGGSVSDNTRRIFYSAANGTACSADPWRRSALYIAAFADIDFDCSFTHYDFEPGLCLYDPLGVPRYLLVKSGRKKEKRPPGRTLAPVITFWISTLSIILSHKAHPWFQCNSDNDLQSLPLARG